MSIALTRKSASGWRRFPATQTKRPFGSKWRLSTLPTSLRWQPRSAAGRLDRNGRRFAAHCGAKAQAFGWTARELFGLHPVPERPAANYSRLSRLDETGLIWLPRGRPVIILTATEAVIRCHSGATLTYRRQNELAPGHEAQGGGP